MTNNEEREVEARRRRLQALMPQIQAAMQGWEREQRQLVTRNLADVFGPQYQRLLDDLSSSMTHIEFPALKLDYPALFPDFAAMQADVWERVVPSVRLIQDAQREQFAQIIAGIRRAVEATLPPNWLGEEISIPDNLEVLLLDEGLPLAWVPPPIVVSQVFSAANSGDRRRVVGRRWRGIVRACMDEIDKNLDPALQEHSGFVRKAAEALLSGSHEASQALSANLLDSILRAKFRSDDRKTITGRQARIDLDDYPLRVSIVLGGIWGAHGQFWPDKGDKIPREYSRHGSAHGVSRRQYSRINAVLALMHVVALLRLIDVDLSDQ